jgi:hypothetical protein
MRQRTIHAVAKLWVHDSRVLLAALSWVCWVQALLYWLYVVTLCLEVLNIYCPLLSEHCTNINEIAGALR